MTPNYIWLGRIPLMEAPCSTWHCDSGQIWLGNVYNYVNFTKLEEITYMLWSKVVEMYVNMNGDLSRSTPRPFVVVLDFDMLMRSKSVLYKCDSDS